MKAKELINQLKKYDGDTEVAIYNHSTGSVLLIPGYEPDIVISQDEEFSECEEMPTDTIYIGGK
jgi:hypothetical protein